MKNNEQVFGYIRVSGTAQVEKGYGLADQERVIKEYCKTNKLELITIFRDEGISGAVNDDSELDLTGRLGLMNLLNNLGNVKKVVVKHTNRIWRNPTAQVLASRALRKEGATLMSVEQPTYSIYNTDKDPTNFLLNGVMELLDSFDKAQTLKKLNAGREQKVASGERGCGTPPLGYQWNYTSGRKTVITDTNNVQLIKQLFNQYLVLKSSPAVANWLNANGYTTQRGKDFNPMSIRTILTNRYYIGELWWDGKQYPANHEPIVPKTIFGKVQAMLERNKKSHKSIEPEKGQG